MLRLITRRTPLGTFAGISLLPAASHAGSDPLAAAEEEFRGILARRIDADRQSLGMVVGLGDRTHSRFIAHGARSLSDHRLPDRDTLFNIGSITKMFTAILLADAVGADA